jgi:hypothetical protein
MATTNFTSLSKAFDAGAVRIIITLQEGEYLASLQMSGAGDGYAVYSGGSTPDIALLRAVESSTKPERWRKLRY